MMRRVARMLAPVAFALAAPCQAGGFASVGTLSQDEFRALSRDLGAAFAYKGVIPATPLGLLGFDVALEVTETRVNDSGAFARAGAGSRSSVVVPKLHVNKGLFGGLDIGAFIGGAQDVDATVLGLDLRYALLDDGVATPAIGMRLSGTRSAGMGDLTVNTTAFDVLVSKRVALITPYAGAGAVRIASSASGTGLASESVNRGRVFGGLNLNLLAVNLGVEIEKMGDNTSVSAKLGWRF